MKIEDVVWDPSIYPRQKWNTSTIERYAEAMRAGAVFPPITVEEGTGRLLDGKHRWEAWKKAKEGQNGISGLRIESAKVPDGVPIKAYAAHLSSAHGDRIPLSELKAIARETFEANPDFKQKTLAQLFNVREEAVSEWVSDITARRREERAAKALRLSMLGWTQQEIAQKLRCDRSLVSLDVKNFGSEDFHALFKSGHAPDEIARRTGLGVELVYAKQLEGTDDKTRLEKLDIKLQPYDVWNFNRCHDLMGDSHPGRIPGELVCHVLYYYTKSGDLVVDPMVGSGTTLDACLLMGRKARGYDVDLRHDRVDVEQNDITNGWPDSVGKASLVFWDPPYFDKMDSATIGEDGYIEGSISKLTPDDYLAFFANAFARLKDKAKPGTTLAFLMSDWDPVNAKQHADHRGIYLWDYVKAMECGGLVVERQIQCPLPTQQVHPDIVNKFREQRRMARLGRYLLIAKVE